MRKRLPARPPNAVCARCKSANNLTQDHVVELWIADATFPDGPDRTGALNFFNSAANLQTLCNTCHLRKTKLFERNPDNRERQHPALQGTCDPDFVKWIREILNNFPCDAGETGDLPPKSVKVALAKALNVLDLRRAAQQQPCRSRLVNLGKLSPRTYQDDSSTLVGSVASAAADDSLDEESPLDMWLFAPDNSLPEVLHLFFKKAIVTQDFELLEGVSRYSPFKGQLSHATDHRQFATVILALLQRQLELLANELKAFIREPTRKVPAMLRQIPRGPWMHASPEVWWEDVWEPLALQMGALWTPMGEWSEQSKKAAIEASKSAAIEASKKAAIEASKIVFAGLGLPLAASKSKPRRCTRGEIRFFN
jgi:hypothetical protein